jgi:hypothetical protein
MNGIKKLIIFLYILFYSFTVLALPGVPEDIKDYNEFSKWVTNNFVYKFMYKKYIQSPKETIRLKAGVCGDFAVLYSAFLTEMGVHNEILILEIEGAKDLHAVCIWKDNSGNYIVSDNKRLIFTYKKTIPSAMNYIYWDLKRLFKIRNKEELYKCRPYPQPPVFLTPIKIKE